MAKYYLVNLDAKEICGASDNEKELTELGEKSPFGYQVANEKFDGFTLVDLVNYYNNLPGTKQKIERFSDKTAGIRRITEVIERDGVCPMRKGKPRKTRSEGSGAGRRASWETVSVSAAGKSDEIKFHKDNPRFKVFEVIKRREEVTRDALIKFCEESLSIKRPAVMAAVGKLLKRGLVKTK